MVHVSSLPELPPPEKLRVHVGQMPFATMDSAVLSPADEPLKLRLGSMNLQELPEKKRKRLDGYFTELTKLEEDAKQKFHALEELLMEKPTQNVGTAFVCFTSMEATRFALTHDLAHPACPVFRALPPAPGVKSGGGDRNRGTSGGRGMGHGEDDRGEDDRKEDDRREDDRREDDRGRQPDDPGRQSADTDLSVAREKSVIKCTKCNKNLEVEHCHCGSVWNARWRVREAPPPEDIIWSNMHIRRSVRAYRIVIVNIGIFLLLFTLTSSTVGATVLLTVASNLEQIVEKASFFKVSVSGWLMPNFLYLINALLLPFLVSQGANASKFWRTSSRDRTVLYANVHYMVINSLVFPVLGTTSFQTLLLFFTNTSLGRVPTLLGTMTAGASGSFVLRYLLNTICINSSMQLMQLPMFSQQRVFLRLGKRANRWNFDYGFWYAFHLAVFAVCIVFSVDFPLVPLMGGVFFTAKFWVDKYNLTMKVWRTRSESAGVVASSAVSFIFYFVALFLFLMAGYYFAVAVSAKNAKSSVQDAVFNPDENIRNLTIGAAVLLVTSLLVLLMAAGEKAQRSILLTHASTFRKWVHKLRTKFARQLENWNITAPLRGVVQTVVEPVSPSRISILRKAYVHPFECGDRLELLRNTTKRDT
ncbi:putative transmembrane protein [Gregarina niphandrodes]|uniref:Transmembrane protein n=1 Tax=Gregarina niphandrodes TaxID=110365 RepID=A0A023BCH9_GRENI|nr:putative transmembrane protein [Gregarina niphandrodes]EZG83933.1 putative transmembrane protein [Gregarina niphandrodes]|eukprot:XP_011128886.1 putative transmembrane protein [Gregarina niphandrodes]